jgi:5-methylcytosine-specific restriction endonuclease McrA
MAPRLTTHPGKVATLDTRTVKPPPKQADPFYLSPAWRTLVAAITEARGHRCELCGRTRVRLYADHVLELADGGEPLDAGNLQLVCGSCHGKKTAAHRARRMAQRY